jgi:hypothetical protein
MSMDTSGAGPADDTTLYVPEWDQDDSDAHLQERRFWEAIQEIESGQLLQR